jgi:hypothetical protein
LAVHFSSFVDEGLAGQQEVVVSPEGLVEHLPDAEGAFWEYLCQFLPVFLALLRDAFLLLAFGQLLQGLLCGAL